MNTRAGRGSGVGRAALLLALAAPLLVVVAAAAMRVQPFSRALIFDLVVMTAGRWLAWAALAAAVLAVIHALGDLRRRGVWAVAALLVAGATVGLYWRQSTAFASGAPADVSSDPADPPQGPVSAVPAVASCNGLTAVPVQLTSEQASEALQASGFTVTRSGLFHIQGVRQAFWFRAEHEAAIRIRPGRTDIRVVAAHPESDGGAACRLALRLRDDLQARR